MHANDVLKDLSQTSASSWFTLQFMVVIDKGTNGEIVATIQVKIKSLGVPFELGQKGLNDPTKSYLDNGSKKSHQHKVIFADLTVEDDKKIGANWALQESQWNTRGLSLGSQCKGNNIRPRDGINTATKMIIIQKPLLQKSLK